MNRRIVRLALARQGVVTVALLSLLLVNLTVIGRIDPPDGADAGTVPFAGRCQGGGPGCAEQPLLPHPAGGLPRFEMPPAPVLTSVLAEPAPAPAPRATTLDTLAPPPRTDSLI